MRAALGFLSAQAKSSGATLTITDPPTDPLEELADSLLLDAGFLKEIKQLLDAKRQVVFYGPPGTGKTFVARELGRCIAESEDHIEIVQFHPSYAYEDFVEGIRPHLDGAQVGFRLVRGPLRRIAKKAAENPSGTFILLIDEINRGNVAKTFGELYFLLEYRDEAISLQYSEKEKFKLPKNLFVIGTMNTADRSIALIDAALRRRFFFVPFFPNDEPIKSLLRRWLKRHKPEMAWVADVVERANDKIGSQHAHIGPSHFMTSRLNNSWVEKIWKHSILPYLAEQFFGEEERLKDFSLAKLREAPSVENEGTDT